MYRIDISLPLSRPRPGMLVLSNTEGRPLLPPFFCLGKADNARATRAGNPDRDPTKPYGDTPAGVYAETSLVKFGAAHRRLGRAWIPIDGAEGQALRAVEGGRTGLGIHAGRGNDRLIPTYGCVRMLDREFDLLAHRVGRGPIVVTIVEVS